MPQPKLLKNSLSLLVNRLTQAITSFIITTIIARNLGAYELGQYILALSYYYFFVTIASQGLKTFFTRELSREPQETPVYLVSGSLLQFIVSIISYFVLVIVVFLLPYSPDTSIICYIMGLAIFPFALSNITEAIFQSQEKMHLIAISTVPVYILRLLVIFFVINWKHSVNYIAGIMVVSETLILVIEWILIIRIVKQDWHINRDFIVRTLYSVRTFFAMDALGMIAGKLDVFMISLLGSEFLIGLYGAVTQLMQPFSIVANSASLAAFPGMSKAVYLGKEKQRENTENIIEFLLCISLPYLVGLLFFGDELLIFVYKGQSFAQASVILNIISISLITSTFCRAISYLLIANGLEKFNLVEVAFTSFVGGLAGTFLIFHYKLLGAAFTGLIMSFTSFVLFMYTVYSRLFSLRLWLVIRRPLLISILMTLVFFILKVIHLEFLITLTLSICAYGLLMGLLTAHQLGGFHKIWQKILRQGNYVDK